MKARTRPSLAAAQPQAAARPPSTGALLSTLGFRPAQEGPAGPVRIASPDETGPLLGATAAFAALRALDVPSAQGLRDRAQFPQLLQLLDAGPRLLLEAHESLQALRDQAVARSEGSTAGAGMAELLDKAGDQLARLQEAADRAVKETEALPARTRAPARAHLAELSAQLRPMVDAIDALLASPPTPELYALLRGRMPRVPELLD